MDWPILDFLFNLIVLSGLIAILIKQPVIPPPLSDSVGRSGSPAIGYLANQRVTVLGDVCQNPELVEESK